MARLAPKLVCSTILVAFVVVSSPRPARAEAPDPVIASVMSAGATVVPLTLSAILLATGRGADEGIRFDAGMVTLGLGSVVGPSAGQLYARGGTDAFVTFLLRAVTGAVMLVGVGFALRGPDNRQVLGTSLAVTGGVPTGLLAIYDIYAAAISARDARYEAGYAEIEVPPELVDVALCGPMPCARAGDGVAPTLVTYR